VCALALAAIACGGDSSTATTPSAPAPAPGTEAFTGTMARGGTAIRNFTASAAGTASVTMLTTDPGGTLLGLGIGIPGTNAGSCDMTTTIQTRAGSAPQLTATVEPGTFCAGVFDIGTVGVNGVVVGMTVAHP
jgi:hypothetical protein